MLTDKDWELIRQQCALQEAESESEIRDFATAYETCKNFSTTAQMLKYPEDMLIFIHLLAYLVDENNAKGIRTVPVRFRNGNKGLDADKIPRALMNLCEAIVEGQVDAEEAYKEFELIHPFEDGNGRVGDLLWKMITHNITGEWPQELPPDIFG